MSIKDTGLHIKRVAVCTAHQWYTPVDTGGQCLSHRDKHLVTRYQVFSDTENALGGYAPAYRANGDVVVYGNYSSAYSYCTR